MSTPVVVKVLTSSSSRSSLPKSQTDDIDLDMTVTEVVNNDISETDKKEIEGEKDTGVEVEEPVVSQSGEVTDSKDPNQDDSHGKRPGLKIKLAVRRKVGSSEKVAVVPAKGKAGRPKKSTSATKKRALPSSPSRPHRSTTPVSYEDVDFPDWEESDNEASVSSASKKKAGRPRKSDAPEIKQGKSDSNTPRGRGRPKKTEQPKEETNGKSSGRSKQKAADLPQTSSKKKRGRPKKAMSAAGDLSDISEDDDDSAGRPQARRRERSQDDRGESSKENTTKNSRNIRKRLVLVGHSDAYSDSSYSPSEEDDDDYMAAGGKKRKLKEAGSDEDFKPYKLYYNKKRLAQAKLDADPNAPKKGRGRPRTTPKPSGETPKPQKSSKGRGRPRKAPKPDKDVVQQPKIPNRGRGRPPKVKRPTNDSPAKEDAAPFKADAEVKDDQSKESDAVCAT